MKLSSKTKAKGASTAPKSASPPLMKKQTAIEPEKKSIEDILEGDHNHFDIKDVETKL